MTSFESVKILYVLPMDDPYIGDNTVSDKTAVFVRKQYFDGFFFNITKRIV